MKNYTLSVLFFMLMISGPAWAQGDWTDKTRVLPDRLREVSETIYLRHDPNPNYPEEASEEDDTPYRYVWKHSTYVLSPKKTLTVIEAGSFIWYTEEGWKVNVQFDRKKFAKRFHCPKGILEAGKEYVFEKNYRYGDHLYGGDALWYVIAQDEDGNVYRGLSILETESTLKSK